MRISSLLAWLLIPTFTHAAELRWHTDFNEAKAAAQAGNKTIMLDFTGSDWCGWCIKLKKEVFDTPEFAAYAAEKLVLVEVDFPQQKKLSKAQTDANQSLAASYQIRGYPTLIFLDAQGNPKAKGGYMAGGPKAFLSAIDPAVSGTAPAIAAHPVAAPEAPRPQPATPPPAGVMVNYTELQLKGISGSKKHRLALINGQAFEVNDEATIALGKKELNVKCTAIGTDSVKIVVDGTEKELKLGP